MSIIPIYFIKGYNEWTFFLLQQINRFDSLLFQPVHNIHDQNGNIAKGRTSIPKIREGLVTGGVDDKQSWDFKIHI